MINENRQGLLADQPRGPAPLATAKQSFLDSLASIGVDLWVPGIRTVEHGLDRGWEREAWCVEPGVRAVALGEPRRGGR
jgi:hypothetical protein